MPTHSKVDDFSDKESLTLHDLPKLIDDFLKIHRVPNEIRNGLERILRGVFGCDGAEQKSKRLM